MRSGRAIWRAFRCAPHDANRKTWPFFPQAEFDLALKIADAALYEIRDCGRNGGTGFKRRADDPNVFEGSLNIEALVERGALVRKRIRSPATDAPGQ